MIEELAKVVLGTALYVAVLWEARRNPRAAGMMLTFPTLNGISMLVVEPAALEEAAGAMLLLPVLNGIFCAGYLKAFDTIMVCTNRTPAETSRILLAGIAVTWSLLAWQITDQAWSVPTNTQLHYVLALAVAGILMTLAALPSRRVARSMIVTPEPLWRLLRRNHIRIALFAIALIGVAVANQLKGAASALGVLAALPLVSLFSLHTIATDEDLSPDRRRDELEAMANGVWLGPAIASGFIVVFWRLMASLSFHVSGIYFFLAGTLTLVVCWGLCIAAIGACEMLLYRLQSLRQ